MRVQATFEGSGEGPHAAGGDQLHSEAEEKT